MASRSTNAAIDTGLDERLPLLALRVRMICVPSCATATRRAFASFPRELIRAWSLQRRRTNRLRDLVYDTVVTRFGGSFSAEHGVGPYNVAYYKRYTSDEERAFAGKLKGLCDPKGILGNIDFG